MNCLLQNPTGNTKSRLTPTTNSQIRLRNNRPHPNNSGHRKYSRVPASLVSQASNFFGRDPHHTTRQSLDTDDKTYSRIVNNQSVPKLKSHKRVDATTHLPQEPIAKKRHVKQWSAAFRLPCQDHRSISKFANECTSESIPMPAQRFPISYQATLRFLTPPHSFERKTCTTCTTKLR